MAILKTAYRRRVRKTKLPRTGTNACGEFFISWQKINEFFHFLLHLVSHIEHVAEIAHKALVKTVDETERLRLEKEWEKRRGPVEELKKHRQFLLEIILVRHVENYLNYLSSLLFEIFVQRPETLKSQEKVDIEPVLSAESRGDLVRSLAQRRVESLSYKAFADLSGFFEERFGLPLITPGKAKFITEAIETRNISVHNRCIVNERYLHRTGADRNKLGKIRELYIQDIENLVPLIADAVKILDRKARKTLRLKGRRFRK